MKSRQVLTANGPFDLARVPIHLGQTDGQRQGAVVLDNFGFDPGAFETYIAELCPDGSGRLLMVESSPGDWGYWECHPRGDEVVLVLTGRAEFIQELGGAE